MSLPKSEIRAGKLLVDPGHPQEELVGGRPHHRYIKTHRCRPRVDRVLQKNTHTAENLAKKLPEASISLKGTVFKLCCPAHLFPNTPRTTGDTGIEPRTVATLALTVRCSNHSAGGFAQKYQ